MFAVYASGPNPDDPLESLVVGDRPEPDVPDGWVEIAVTAGGLNMHDLWTLRGVGIAPDRFPITLGMDCVGRLADGKRVVVYPVINDPAWTLDEVLDPRRSLLTETHQGTFAERVTVPVRNTVPVPTGLSDEEAAVMPSAWLTAYRMLFTKSRMRPGQTMLVQGASGGVSSALIQMGRAAGMVVWVTGQTDEKQRFARRLGAHSTFAAGADLPERVDVVFESVGAATWAHSMRALRPGGAIIVCGATTGAQPGADLRRLFFRELRIEGATMGTRAELVDMLTFVDRIGIRPQIAETMPMAQARRAFENLSAGRTAGKIVLTLAD